MNSLLSKFIQKTKQYPIWSTVSSIAAYSIVRQIIPKQEITLTNVDDYKILDVSSMNLLLFDRTTVVYDSEAICYKYHTYHIRRVKFNIQN